ncbi:L-aspartate oxidase [Helicobacter typhlonius]|uniref:L-aspartate oxidase n=1 Tax=Helicobacter typhlonius TaxID=76936 RepID=UPI002FDF9099
MGQYDAIIIGAGVAGLYCAAHLPKNLKVLILCKSQPWECNTFYAQGGISIAKDNDDVLSHTQDTLSAGGYLNNKQCVEMLASTSPKILNELIESGFVLDRDSNNALLYAKEGGHSKARIVHSGGDATGRNLHTHLINRLSATLWKNAEVVDLLIEEDKCYGVCVQTKLGTHNLYAHHIVIASGGVGGLFKYHTNAYTISSDIHGIILEHHLALQDMEMLQFHPTAYVRNPQARKYLISEAVRGEGGVIVDEDGKRFLFDYDERGELAPRDIVARGIMDYCTKHKKEVFLDVSVFDKAGFKNRFPNIYRDLSTFLDIPNEKIPISPAFHYSMGGIAVDINGLVKGMSNLYAVGECACNGLHGGNRLASNSLLEGLVFGSNVAKHIVENPTRTRVAHFPLCEEVLEKEGDVKLKNVLREIMWDKVGIIRSKSGLDSALGGIEVMLESNIGRMLRLRLLVARRIIESALTRTESKGAHFRVD